jgi:hypothetical protein
MMNMDKVICIGYFVAGYKKNNDALATQREKCPQNIEPPYPDIAKLTVMDDTVKRKLLSSKWNDSHIFKFPSRYINIYINTSKSAKKIRSVTRL